MPAAGKGAGTHEEKIGWTIQATLLLPATNEDGQPITYQTTINNGQHRAVGKGAVTSGHKDYTRRNVQTVSENISIHGILKHIKKAGCTPTVEAAEEHVFMLLKPSTKMAKRLKAQKAGAKRGKR